MIYDGNGIDWSAERYRKFPSATFCSSMDWDDTFFGNTGIYKEKEQRQHIPLQRSEKCVTIFLNLLCFLFSQVILFYGSKFFLSIFPTSWIQFSRFQGQSNLLHIILELPFLLYCLIFSFETCFLFCVGPFTSGCVAAKGKILIMYSAQNNIFNLLMLVQLSL